MRRRWRRDVRVQVVLMYAAMVAVVLAGFWQMARFAEQRLVADVEAADRALAQSIALETETSLRFALEAVAALAREDAVLNRDWRRLEVLFGTAMTARRDLILVYLLAEDGTMLFHYPLGPGSTVGWNFAFRDYFQAARATRDPVLSKGRISPTTQKPVVTAAAAVRDGNGRFPGVVGTNKPDSEETVRHLLEDLDSLPPCPEPDSQAVKALLTSRGVRVISFEDWKKIDAEEIARGQKAGKVREKLVRWEDIVAVLDR